MRQGRFQGRRDKLFSGAEAREGPVCGDTWRVPITGFEAEPSAGSRDRAPVRGQWAKPPEAERFSALEYLKEAAFLAFSGSFGNFAVIVKPALALRTTRGPKKPSAVRLLPTFRGL